jgi:hypothetical protein
VKRSSVKHKWYENYLPFVVRSTEMQVEWLSHAVRKGKLAPSEIAPYINLVLSENRGAQREVLRTLLNRLDESTLDKMVSAAEIQDLPDLFSMLDNPTVDRALIALLKAPAPYEKNPFQIVHKVFHAIHDASPELLEKAVEELRAKGLQQKYFEEAYGQFVEVLEDEKILSVLFPKAR